MKVLVLGATGMLGNAIFRVLSEKEDWKVFGSLRSQEAKKFFSPQVRDQLVVGTDVEDNEGLNKLFAQIDPDVVINCISLPKKVLVSKDPLRLIPIYSLLPHRLANLCHSYNARLVHISTDGVFSGSKGGYTEEDPADAQDLYGVSKFLGEVHASHAINIRTSIIGSELQGCNGLIAWFLSQEGRCKCFSHSIFSGLPTVVLAQIIRDVVIPRHDLFGVYHVASHPISKCELLRLVAKIYGKSIEIVPDDTLVINRSLNAAKFQKATGYISQEWSGLVELMLKNGRFLESIDTNGL